VLGHLLGGEFPLRVRAWDGSEAGPAGAPATVVFTNRRALRRVLWAPNELGLGRAYVAGDLAIEGDPYVALSLPDVVGHRELHRGMRLDRRQRREVAATLLGLGAIGPPPRPPAEEVRLSGGVHGKRRDAAAISHHYDVGNDFYRLVLGASMSYSCAFWEREPSPSYDLADAQRAKHDLICRKLGLAAGMRLLDVGCGWGSMAMHAAEVYGVHAVGVTLSRHQAELARKRVAEAGLTDRVEIRVQDYRDIHDGPYDAISSIGMAEHVGHERYAEYAGDLFGLLRPGGRLLNHQIATHRLDDPGGVSFIDRYVFPDGELLPVSYVVTALERAGFEIRDLQALREHYALTLRAWVANLQRHWDEALTLVTPGRARVWLLYMVGSALSFETNRIGVNQVLAVRPGEDGASGVPRTRGEWLATG
jgi:cyclopropane-fatty-acyl-phospholipid synthase